MAQAGYCDVYARLTDFTDITGDATSYIEVVLYTVPQKSNNELLFDKKIKVEFENNYASFEARHNAYISCKIQSCSFECSFVVPQVDSFNLADFVGSTGEYDNYIIINPSDHGLLFGLDDPSDHPWALTSDDLVWGGINGNINDQTDLQNILNSLLPSGDLVWGNIGGTLSDQTDLQSELDGKEDLLGFTPANELIEITGAGLLVGQGGDLTTNRIFTLNNSDIDHDQLNNTHNLTTDINHNTILNNHNLTTDINHLNISNVGINTHNQIDAHLALTNEHIDWTSTSGDFLTYGTVTAKKFTGWGIVPIGATIPWSKSLSGVPSLPDGFVEENGQVITDTDSPLYGVTLDNSNGYGGQPQRFLRGAQTSGGTGGSDTHAHGLSVTRKDFYHGFLYYMVLNDGTTDTASASTLPRYVEKVMIIRIK